MQVYSFMFRYRLVDDLNPGNWTVLSENFLV